jgi:signal transduction histidine kinase
MEVICQNILSNAMTYGDRLRITGKPEDGRFRLEIQDNGPGVEAEELKNSLYSQAEAPEPESARLGLKVTVHLLRKLDGDLKFTSTPGQGTTFILEFPQARLDRESQSRLAAST